MLFDPHTEIFDLKRRIARLEDLVEQLCDYDGDVVYKEDDDA